MVVLLVDLGPLQPDTGLAPLTAGPHHPLEHGLVSVDLAPDCLDGSLQPRDVLHLAILGKLLFDDGPNVLNGQEVCRAAGHLSRNSLRKSGVNSVQES